MVTNPRIALSAWAVKYTDCIFAEGQELPNECPDFETKQSDYKAPVMQELWKMRITSLLSSLPGPLWARMDTSDRILCMGQIELNGVFMLNWIVLKFNRV